MKVRELIEALAKQDPDAEVLLRDEDHTGVAMAYAVEAKPGIRTHYYVTDLDEPATDWELEDTADEHGGPAERAAVVVIAGEDHYSRHRRISGRDGMDTPRAVG